MKVFKLKLYLLFKLVLVVLGGLIFLRVILDVFSYLFYDYCI